MESETPIYQSILCSADWRDERPLARNVVWSALEARQRASAVGLGLDSNVTTPVNFIDFALRAILQ